MKSIDDFYEIKTKIISKNVENLTSYSKIHIDGFEKIIEEIRYDGDTFKLIFIDGICYRNVKRGTPFSVEVLEKRLKDKFHESSKD